MSDENTAAPAATPAIYAAVMGVMADVRAIGKNRTMPPEAKVGEYAYRSAEDVENAVAASFREHMIMTQSTITRAEYTENTVSSQRGTTVWTSCRLTVRFRFTSLVDGSFVEFEAPGEGRDNSDKATGKAMTSAHKSAVTTAFEVAYHHADPEAERPMVTQAHADRPAPPPAPDNRTDAQRQAEEAYRQRRAAGVAAQTRPADPDPLARATADLQDGLNAQPIGSNPVQQAFDLDKMAHAALSRASKIVVENDLKGKSFEPQNDQQAARCRDAIRAAEAAPSRAEVNKIILQAEKEGLLHITVDSAAVGYRLNAARGMHMAQAGS